MFLLYKGDEMFMTPGLFFALSACYCINDARSPAQRPVFYHLLSPSLNSPCCYTLFGFLPTLNYTYGDPKFTLFFCPSILGNKLIFLCNSQLVLLMYIMFIHISINQCAKPLTFRLFKLIYSDKNKKNGF